MKNTGRWVVSWCLELRDGSIAWGERFEEDHTSHKKAKARCKELQLAPWTRVPFQNGEFELKPVDVKLEDRVV